MALITYKITAALPTEAINDILNQPNFKTIESTGNYYSLIFDHTPEQSIAFKKFLLSRIFLYGEDIFQYIDTIQLSFYQYH